MCFLRAPRRRFSILIYALSHLGLTSTASRSRSTPPLSHTNPASEHRHANQPCERTSPRQPTLRASIATPTNPASEPPWRTQPSALDRLPGERDSPPQPIPPVLARTSRAVLLVRIPSPRSGNGRGRRRGRERWRGAGHPAIVRGPCKNQVGHAPPRGAASDQRLPRSAENQVGHEPPWVRVAARDRRAATT